MVVVVVVAVVVEMAVVGCVVSGVIPSLIGLVRMTKGMVRGMEVVEEKDQVDRRE